jgi:hypothetical protein
MSTGLSAVGSQFPLRNSGRRGRRLRIAILRLGRVGTGLLLMVVGLLSVPTPLPAGFVLFVLGLYLVTRGSKRVRRSVTDLRRRLPPFSRGLNRLKPHLPQSVHTFIERSDPGE